MKPIYTISLSVVYAVHSSNHTLFVKFAEMLLRDATKSAFLTTTIFTLHYHTICHSYSIFPETIIWAAAYCSVKIFSSAVGLWLFFTVSWKQIDQWGNILEELAHHEKCMNFIRLWTLVLYYIGWWVRDGLCSTDFCFTWYINLFFRISIATMAISSAIRSHRLVADRGSFCFRGRCSMTFLCFDLVVSDCKSAFLSTNEINFLAFLLPSSKMKLKCIKRTSSTLEHLNYCNLLYFQRNTWNMKHETLPFFLLPYVYFCGLGRFLFSEIFLSKAGRFHFLNYSCIKKKDFTRIFVFFRFFSGRVPYQFRVFVES